MENTQPNKTIPSKINHRLAIALAIAFTIAALLTAYLTFVAVRDFVAQWKLTNLPGVTIQNGPTSTPDASGVIGNPSAPLQAPGAPTPVPWDGASRVTLLLMGLDYRDWQAGNGPPRTDTMILMTLDPIHHTAGILSIPRDLWVNIPGSGYGRINTAYPIGEGAKLPGGGPGLAMKTVEEFLGVPIDYYAQIDFAAFVQFIDEIGGVKIDVPEKIQVDPMNSEVKTLKPGRQTLPGELALAYARARHTSGGDFDRAQRQQQVIMGIRNQILSFDMIPTMMARSGALYNEFSAGVHTNLSLDEIFKLAWLAQQIPEDQIKKGIISPPEQVSLAKAPDGSSDVLKPITEKIRMLRDEIFTDSGPISPAASSMNPADLMKAEAAKVSVQNGTATTGIASKTADYLKSQGVNITDAGNAQKLLTYTEITFYNGKPYTVKFLMDLMKVDKTRIHYIYDPTSTVDVKVVVGEDWAAKNPMP